METAPPVRRAAVIFPADRTSLRAELRGADARLEEAAGLTRSIGLDIMFQQVIPLRAARPATLLGAGQVEALATKVHEGGIDVVVVDTRLSPVQQRNLEKALNCKVIDRTGLILDIFGARAATREGVLQVELAHLAYQKSRLVRLWTHLERQRGGFGFLGGPGETQMEADRRMLSERMVKLKKELDQVRRTRGLHRAARQRVPFPVVAFVGYTNAGKSTLFNALTGADVQAEDQLFATLDPTMRSVTLPSGRRIILSDTVGFISDLPTELIAAFRATLEEVAEADVIVHVRNVAHPDSDAQREDVIQVLNNLVRDGVLDETWPERVVEVLNKSDILGGVRQVAHVGGAVPVSALTQEGLPDLLSAIDAQLTAHLPVIHVKLSIQDGAAMAWLYEYGDVIERTDEEAIIRLTVRLSDNDLKRFERSFPEYLDLIA
ncbi:GTPase HflX [Candidatus Kirkpatrickella diaphorinae]|uniref:GTPase HflX n=1 Tax=Candidatus Kirkpatrickella diaphorinae TaxID=2984322 RepID=A0ABY6GLU3_9PROT|nr:GTPase HflX [Candidatus Kirkpatrickella diaphorinae]UYH52304.1 GTPase HflX [Candidatus Kirkpatrickella diaphorinae]